MGKLMENKSKHANEIRQTFVRAMFTISLNNKL